MSYAKVDCSQFKSRRLKVNAWSQENYKNLQANRYLGWNLNPRSPEREAGLPTWHWRSVFEYVLLELYR